jgi:hypothetical protein
MFQVSRQLALRNLPRLLRSLRLAKSNLDFVLLQERVHKLDQNHLG